MAKISIKESELKARIAKCVNEALQDEGIMDFIKGAGRQIGGDVAKGARSAWDKGKQVANNAAQGVKNYANNVKTAGQKASMNADNQKIADQLQKWYNQGVFGNSRQVSSWVSGLVNCLNGNFNSRFGEGGNAHR